jgi:hypothetical protein
MRALNFEKGVDLLVLAPRAKPAQDTEIREMIGPV